jgi:hypothetical protein
MATCGWTYWLCDLDILVHCVKEQRTHFSYVNLMNMIKSANGRLNVAHNSTISPRPPEKPAARHL